MVKTYSRRLLAPFSGQVQIAETGDARALSLDGKNWEIQYRVAARKAPPGDRSGNKQNYQYVRIAGVRESTIQRHPVHPLLDVSVVNSAIDRLAETVIHAPKPFPSLDMIEFWLLDEADNRPLALITAGIDAEEVAASRAQPKWTAMPASQLDIQEPPPPDGHYVAPINYRLQKLVEHRAGPHPRGAWFDRGAQENTAFPSCLIREDWDSEEESSLCQRYIQRLAPRLLMLQGLSDCDRSRLEQASSQHALEVEQFCPLYPNVIDQKLMNRVLVEARMRRAVAGSG